MSDINQGVRVTRLDLDSSEIFRDQLNAQFLANARRQININSGAAIAGNALTQGGNVGKLTPMQSTDLLCDVAFPEGTNICIGAYQSVKTNEIYSFIFNSLGNHSIYVYGSDELTCRKVYEGECLNFRFPPEYHVPEHRVSLFVVYDQQDGAKTIRNKYLVFTEGYNWQFFIDVESSIATDSYNPITFPYFTTFYPHCDPCEFIQLGIRPPQDCPKVLPFDDDTALQHYVTPPENNNLKEKVWYFATSFIDVWGRRSVISPYSTAVFLDGGDCNVNAEDIKCFKLVLDAGSAIVDKIVVYFSNNGIDWFQYDVIDKWEDCISPPDANFWEKELALKNYFAPFEGSPPESPFPECAAEGEFSTNTYTWDFSESPPLTFPTAISIEINGVDYTSPSVASTNEIAAWITSLGFGTAIAVSTVVFTSSDTIEFGDILFDDSPIEIIIPVEIITDHQEFGAANTFIYQFCANKQCIPIAANEVDRYFDDLPIASVAQAIVDDRIALGDNLVGYDNFICPIENVQITAVQEEQSCETDLVTVIIDAVIQNPYTENNEPIYKIGDAVAFGGLGDITIGGVDYEDEVISVYQQQIVNKHQNFIGRLRGTNYIAIGQQYKIGEDDPIEIPAPTTDKQRQNMMKGAYNGNFYYQRFTFKVPKGNYIFQIDSHLADGIVDSQYTSTYFWGAILKTSYDPDGSITVDDSIREVRFTACEDFTYDYYVVIADLTKPKASISLQGDAKAFNGYLRKSDVDPTTETGHDPIELANVDITDCTAATKTITMWTPQTDHNGFYFGTDGGADYCVNITILDSTCAQVSPTGSINQIGVNSKTLVVQNIIQTNPANYAECAYELIIGTITDCNGNPVSGVSVVLSYTGRYGITDANGEYRILAHDSAYWEATLGQTRKQRNVDNLFIAPLGACLYNDCDNSPEQCNTCIDLTHVDWTASCFGSPACTPATNIYDFELDIISGALKGVKTAGTYAVSLVGYDYLDRNNSAQRIGFFSIPSIQYNGVFAPYHFNWAFTGNLDLPSWVKKIRFAVRGNDNQFLLSWVTNKVEFIDSIGDITGAGIATNIKVYIDGLNDFNTENFFNTNTGYSWVKGDRIRFITNGDGSVFDTVSNNGLIDLPVSKLVDGHILLVPFDARLVNLTAGATFELYRVPICTTEAVYWEQCDAIPVLFNEETQTYEPTVTSGTIPFFDTYWFFRAIPQTNQFGLPSLFISPHRYEHHSPSDFWGDHQFAIGRGFVRNENARQTWRLDEIQWSDTLLEDGVINGLGTWRTENRKDYSIQDFGGIVAMKAQRHFLWVLCENDWFAVNIAVNLLQITAEGNIIANPDYFGAAQQRVGSVYGCDLRDTNSIIFKGEWISWADVKRAAWCLSNYRIAWDITQYQEGVSSGGVKSYFIEKFRYLASVRALNQFTDLFMYVHSGYDPKTGEIIITFAKNTDDVLPLVVTLSGTNLTCYGVPTGEIISNVSGGTPPYFYLWSYSDEAITANLENVDAGTYTLTVTDVNGLIAVKSITITQPTQIVLTSSHTNVTVIGGSNGTASVVAMGGSGGYTYLWSNGATASVITGLFAGNYSVTVTDSSGCSSSVTIAVTQPGMSSNFVVETTETDLVYLIDTVSDSVFIDRNTKTNIDKDRFLEPSATHLYAMRAEARVFAGDAGGHEIHYVDPIDSGSQINGTRATYTIDCSDLPGIVQYNTNYIQNSLACGIHPLIYWKQTLLMAQAEGSRVFITDNPRVVGSAELLIAITQYNSFITDDAPIVIGGFEYGNQGFDNQDVFPGGGVDYVAREQPKMNDVWASYPDALFIVNSIEVFKGGSHVVPWNAALAAFDFQGHTKIAMMYEHSEDETKHLDGSVSYLPELPFNKDQWRNGMLDGVLVTFASHVALFKTVFSGFKLFLSQIGLSADNDKLNDFGTTNAMLWYAMLQRQVLIEHINDPNLIFAAAWYRPAGMDKATPRNDWYAHLAFAELFRNPDAKMATVTISLPFVYGVAVKAGLNYVIHLVNVSDDDIVIANMNIDGVLATSFAGTMYYGTALNSTTVLTQAFSGTLKAYCVAYLTYTAP